MGSKSKNLSNPASVGGIGHHFEAHVQASFVALMLTGGYAPCLPCWPITEIKLQGKIDGFDTDDLIVFVEKGGVQERRKLLGQIKHSVTITNSSDTFAGVIQAAWNDFSNPMQFTKGKDIIALITGPLSSMDTHNVQWLLGQARHTKSAKEFFRNVEQSNFSPPKSLEKLAVFEHHLKSAKGRGNVSRDELYSFLNHFHLLSYDLGKEGGVILSLLHSHISQFHQQNPQWVWSRVVDIVQTWNQDAGTIIRERLPEDLVEVFAQRTVTEIPKELTPMRQVIAEPDWNQHSIATQLALTNLVGEWNENNEADIAVLSRLLGANYDRWVQEAREILHYPDSPLLQKNGHWKIKNRVELGNSLGSRVFDQDLDIFRHLAAVVLTERDPSFELPVKERYTASIRGKALSCSVTLRKGMAEGLAILGSNPTLFRNCSQGKAVITAVLTIHEVFNNADWTLWGSLNDLLPTLAEAAPNEFLNIVENTLRLSPSPFDQLFAQEGNGIVGHNYLTGLLWALEGLAWDEKFLVRVCTILGELASHDPGGQWSNRPANSLTTILLPWLPQTLASIEKRKVAIQTLNKEWPEVCWKLVISLLPNQHQVSSGSHKPTWRKTIPDGWTSGVSHQEYWQQVSIYSELAVSSASLNVPKLAELIDHFDHLPRTAFDQLLEALSSDAIANLPEEQRLLIWDHLVKFTTRHRRYAQAEWVLPNELLALIEIVADRLAPSNPLNLYQHLFSDQDFDLYDEHENLEEQQQKLDGRRLNAVKEILKQEGIEGVIRFAEAVTSPGQVGQALGNLSDAAIEQVLLPVFLDSENPKQLALVSRFVWMRHYVEGWPWCDRIDKSSWSDRQIGCFLSFLPFTAASWERANLWLGESRGEYWLRTNANAYHTDEDLRLAIDKLLEYRRPNAAIRCLGRMQYTKQPINVEQCVRSLLMALSSNEPTYSDRKASYC